jgi:NAD(P)-dependent dehydrogenase (short-subunit alcohol dehydrogenase family)
MAKRVAMVTGGGSGIGAACARGLAEDGFVVWVADIDAPSAKAVAVEIEGVAVKLDVTDEMAWTSVIGDIMAKHGRFDVLVNNAGYGAPAPILETTLESWKAQISVNLDGCFLGVREAMRVMIPQGFGSIVNMASLASFRGTPGNAAYCASKAGVHLLTKTAAREAAVTGAKVRINSVHPGLIGTDSAATIVSRSMRVPPEKAFEIVAKTIPLQAVGTPEEVAAVVRFLASDASSYLTGTSINVDGGMHA